MTCKYNEYSREFRQARSVIHVQNPLRLIDTLLFRSKNSLLLPLLFQHSIDDKVNVVIVEKLRLSLNPFLDESESFGYLTTFVVADCTADLHAMQTPFFESIIDERFTPLRDDTLSLAFFGEPISYLNAPVQPIDFMEPNGPDHATSKIDTSCKAVIVRKLIERGPDEEQSVFGSF